MSELKIEHFLEAGKKALEEGNYWGALTIALALPSMCARIKYADEKYKKGNYEDFLWEDDKDSKKWKDKKSYIRFCEETMCYYDGQDELLANLLGKNYCERLYELRCDLLHAGALNVCENHKGIFFLLGDSKLGADTPDYKIVSIKELCESIFEHIKFWNDSSNLKNPPFTSTFIFDMENKDDELLLEQLQKEARAEYLSKKFKERTKAENIKHE